MSGESFLGWLGWKCAFLLTYATSISKNTAEGGCRTRYSRIDQPPTLIKVQNLDCIQFHFLVFLVSILHHFLEEIAWNRPYDAIKSTLNTVWLTSWNWNFVLENSNILLYLASVLARKFKLLIWQVFIQQPFSCIFKVPILKRSVNYLHFIDNLGINFHEVILHLWCGLLLCCNRVWTPDGLTNLVACSTFVRQRRLSRRLQRNVQQNSF